MPYTNTGRMNVTPYTGGGNAQNPADVIFIDSAPPPTGADVLAGTIAIVPSTGETYISTKVSGATVTWVALGGPISGNFTVTNGNLVIATAGYGITIEEGSNARMGQSTLSGGTVTVANTSVTANTRIFLSRASIGATGAAATGNLVLGTVTPGVSFVINSVDLADATALETADVSVVNWHLIEAT